jgi:hypothetical protein
MKYKAGSAIRNNGQTGAVNTGSATYDLTIGDSKGNTTNLPFNGGIGEVIIYNSYLNSTDLGTVNSYLATKWGV